MEPKQITLQVENIKCGGCAGTIISKLKEMPGVQDVEIDIESGKVAVSGNELDAVELGHKLHKMGYPPIGSDNDIITKAKSYISCMTGKVLHS